MIEELLEIEALKIKLLIQEEDDKTLKSVLDELHEADIAQILDNLNEDQQQYVIHLLEIETAASVISEMDAESHPEELISNLDTSLAASIIGEMETDDATDLISLLTEEAQDRVLNQVDKEDAADIRQLMEYSEDTAGGIMNTDLISVPSYFSKKEAVEEVIRQSEEVENFYYVYIIDKQDILVGILSLKDLIRAKPFMIMDEIMEKDIITINVHEDQEEVARVIRKYNLPSLPVVDDEGKLLGRITFDDIMDVIEEENTEDLLMIAGVSVDEELRGGWLDAVKSRMPWLLVNLFTASIAGLVIFSFQNVIDRLIILASYMPIIAGVAGNGATQALAVTIRRLSTDSVAKGQFFNVIIKEVLVGLTNGLLIGFCISMVAYFTNSNLRLGLVVFTAMTLNLFIAGLAGSSIPLLFEKLNIDPAIASSIFITAFTDILGFTLLLGLASQILL